jgi:DNA repair exonuclease SbcCD ATPase subunit
MEKITEDQKRVSVEVENVGGIEHTEVDFEPGVTILAGRNATHRTSFLQAIMAALGSKCVSLKGDAEEARVRLELGDEVYTREFERRETGIHFDGNPSLEDPEIADLYAFLLESNEARRTVALDGDLREIIMEPVDSEAIQAEIEQRESEKREVKERIEHLEELKQELPDLEQERTEVDSELKDAREKLAAKREELTQSSTDSDGAESDQSELEWKVAELERKRSDLEQTEFELESQRESVESLTDEVKDLRERRSEHETEETSELERIQSNIRDLQERKRALNTELNKLQNVIQFNEEMLDGTSEDIAAALSGDDYDGTESVTDQLVEQTTDIVCWTCGTEVERDQIKETLDRLQDLRTRKYSEQNDIEGNLDELKEQQSTIEQRKREQERLDERITNAEAEIDEREAKIEELESKRATLKETIEDLESEIETLEEAEYSEELDLHKEVNRLKIEVERLENDRDRIAENIENLEVQVAEIKSLEQQHEQLKRELAELRTRIEQIEQEAIEEFNTHMDTVLDILAYENIDRIWLERSERETRGGRRTVIKSEFDLHIVRSTDDGVTYEDEFAHLSESEREVTSLVFALAGYLAHNVYEDVPFMLLDSLEAIDSDRIAKLVEYFKEYTEYLIVALLPEDEVALDDSYQRIRNI